MTHNQKNNQTIGTDPEIIEVMQLAEKDIKIISVTVIFRGREGGMFKRERKT